MNNTNRITMKLADSKVTLQGRSGEIILLTGESGSGKSLWLHRFAALADLPEEVSLAANGLSIDKLTTRMLFDRWPCVWLGQTVAQELMFGLNVQPSPQQLTNALSDWGLSAISLDTGPHSLNRIQSLRLSLAAMFLAEADLILLDNPTAALSQADAHAVITDIANKSGQANTIVVVACNRWQDWRSSASQIWRITAPDALPQAGISD